MSKGLKLYLITLCIVSLSIVSHSQVPCTGGNASGYPCSNIDLSSFVPLSTFGSSSANDIWGWTHAVSGREFALIGLRDGTGFVEITNPTTPVYKGKLPTHTATSLWRDVKTYKNHAYVVSEASGHGIQVFDLTQLLTPAGTPVTFSNTAHYDGISNAHNIVINETTGYAYVVGAGTGSQSGCSGGLHIVNINNPASPVFETCYSLDGYTHDAQCITYRGPDTDYYGNEICFCYNEDTQTIVDVTDKSNLIELSRTPYTSSRYTHQGWLTEDHRYSLYNDELDESNNGHNTRTHVMDNLDLTNPQYNGYHESSLPAIDHNNYIKGNYVYQANYRAGLRILRMDNLASPNFTEVGYFDIFPSDNNASFSAAWSVYPYFPSGSIIVSGIEQGLFILNANPAIPTPCSTSFELNLNTDNNAAQTFWNITDTDNGGTVASGNGYVNNNSYTINNCLPSGCYKFTISDAGSDGICCGSGSGNFTISINGNQIRQGGSYGSGESFDFCIYETNQGLCTINLNDSGTIVNSYQVSNTIMSDGVVPNAANVDYKANCIQLNPNFMIMQGATFSATIDPCK